MDLSVLTIYQALLAQRYTERFSLNGIPNGLASTVYRTVYLQRNTERFSFNEIPNDLHDFTI